MICPKCKNEIIDYAKFCGFCGKKFSQPIQIQKKHTNNKTINEKIEEKTIKEQEEEIEVHDDLYYAAMRAKRYKEILNSKTKTIPNNNDKPASVIKRGIAGGIIAGPAGAIVGALSAIDKNNKK